jgi:hypothetical protein
VLPGQFHGPRLAKDLREVLDSPTVIDCCRQVAYRFADDPQPMERACDAIERLLEHAPVPA